MIACLRLPDFAINIARQQHPDLIRQPFVLARYTGRSGKVYAASAEAQALGVHAGMTLSRARALCPEASVLPAETIPSLSILYQLLEKLCIFSDKLEVPSSPDPEDTCIWLDLGKLPDAEIMPLGQRILQTLADFPTALGIANGKTLAQIAAFYTPICEIRGIPAGSETAFLAPLPLTCLPLHSELARRLNQLGLHIFGHLAPLPRSAVQMQFGQDGLRMHHLAHGMDPQPLVAHRFERPICASEWFEEAVADRMVLEGVLCDLAGRLAECLQTANQTCQQIILRLDLEDGSHLETEITPRQPVAQMPALYRLLIRLLDHCPIACGILRVAAELRRLVAVLPRQLALFAEMVSGSERVQHIAERLSLRHNPQDFFTVALTDIQTNLPEQAFRLENLV
jgi:DNA polymerase-4